MRNYTNGQMETIMLDYLNNMRLEHMVSILCMPPDKCTFHADFCVRGSQSYVFWLIIRFLNPKDLRRKVKMLSHMHRQMYFMYLMVENEQQILDKNTTPVINHQSHQFADTP